MASLFVAKRLSPTLLQVVRRVQLAGHEPFKWRRCLYEFRADCMCCDGALLVDTVTGAVRGSMLGRRCTGMEVAA